MPRKNTEKMKETKKEILETLRDKGPSLPIHISRSTDVDMIFASAFLSELVSNKRVRISNMKVGGSPIYYLPGQEEQLEKYFKYLGNREKEAFQKLKDKKVLDDQKQEPPIRVALRSLEDFASHFQIEEKGEEKLYWRFHSVPEEKAIEIVKGGRATGEEGEKNRENREEKEKQVENRENKNNEEDKDGKADKGEDRDEEKREDKSEKEDKKKERKDQKKEETPLLKLKDKEESKTKEKDKGKKKDKSKFVQRVVSHLSGKGIKIIEEKEIKKKGYTAIIEMGSDIGPIKFLCIGKKIKRMSDHHILLMNQKSREENLPVYLVTTAQKFTKKAKEYLKEYSGMIKVRQIE